MNDDRPLSTGRASAAAYRAGIAELVAGRRATAIAAFARSVEADPRFVLGCVALALVSGDADAPIADAVSSARALARWERQHVTVVRLVLDRSCDRAAALAREHLAEYPDDALVRFAVTQHCADVDDLVVDYGATDIGASAPRSNATA
jgi:hypothetical protein